MDDLVTWLRDQLDDDDLSARAVLGADTASWDPYGYLPGEKRDYLTRFDPARVLAEVDAKRRILDRHSRIEVFGTVFCSYCCTLQGQRPGHGYWPCPEILDAAAPYADRPGYRDEWRP